MPALPPVPNVLRVVTNFSISSIPCVNVFHVRYSGTPPTAAQAGQIASSAHSFWSQDLIPWVTSDTLLLHTDVADLSSQLAAVGSFTQHIPGAAAPPTTPNNVAIVGSWAINNRYRGGKPRTYICGLQLNSLQDTTHWNATTVNIIQGALDGIRTKWAGLATPAGVGPFALGCVHYRHANQPLATPYFDAFQSVSVKSAIASQRGRLT